MTDWAATFHDVAAGWRPAGEQASDVVTVEPPTRFAALLDQPSPVTGVGDALPPGWHAFFHLPVHRQASLGPDGHPRSSDALAPPLPEDRRRMFGGGRLEVQSPLRCGDLVVRTSGVARTRATEGRTGPLLLVTLRHALTVRGELRVVEEQHLLYLPPPSVDSASARAPTAARPPPTNAGGWSLALVPDPVLLHRFSALTANAHRIHYDRPYAREVEGHPDLLVHGPLSALLLLELPRRLAPSHLVRQFTWRARRAAFVGQPLVVTGRPDGDDVELTMSAGVTSGAVTGRVTLAPALTTRAS